MATLIRANGTREIVDLASASGASASLDVIQASVGGYFEQLGVPGEPEAALLVNEEGNWLGLPVNVAATTLACRRIVGDVLLVDIVPTRDGYDYR